MVGLVILGTSVAEIQKTVVIITPKVKIMVTVAHILTLNSNLLQLVVLLVPNVVVDSVLAKQLSKFFSYPYVATFNHCSNYFSNKSCIF